MSILTKSKSVISIKQNQSHDLDGWPSKSRSSWLFPDRSHFGCIYDYRLDLHDDFIVFDATDLTVIKIFHVNLTDDLENRGRSYLLWPIVYHGLYTWHRIILAFELSISDVDNLKMTEIWHLISTVDLENQGQTLWNDFYYIWMNTC